MNPSFSNYHFFLLFHSIATPSPLSLMLKHSAPLRCWVPAWFLLAPSVGKWPRSSEWSQPGQEKLACPDPEDSAAQVGAGLQKMLPVGSRPSEGPVWP